MAVGPNPVTDVLIRRENWIQGPGRTLCDDKGRDCGDTVASQGAPRILLNQQKLEGKKKNSLLELPEIGVLPAPGLQTIAFRILGEISVL